jgi:hypothetical protein
MNLTNIMLKERSKTQIYNLLYYYIICMKYKTRQDNSVLLDVGCPWKLVMGRNYGVACGLFSW